MDLKFSTHRKAQDHNGNVSKLLGIENRMDYTLHN